MEKCNTFAYKVRNSVYINLTNKCPCACAFCIRQNGDSAYGSDSLWLAKEPTVDEVLAGVNSLNLNVIDDVDEFVFCGYGEPTERLETLCEVGKKLKEIYDKPVRLNTNGLSDLINSKPTANLLSGCVDSVSISLNSGDEDSYLAVTRPKFGKGSFGGMLKFAEDCKAIPNMRVQFTVVDVITAEEIAKAKDISKKLDIPLRIRKYDGN